MNDSTKTKQLLKILVGVAWIDGLIQPEERKYLHKKAEEYGLADDPDLKSLLSELLPVQPQECYQWLEEYLGSHPSIDDYQKLLEAMGAMIYSDGDVQTSEAQLLTKIQLLDPANDTPQTGFDKLLKTIQKVYRKAVSQQL
ncbi:Tellurite resistance protein TerB [Aphanothece hegewaldii CCALA 016]|uniref:Tellurite resistance protein TerB n=1 Tax=Aphanothece hegewaldii CCALA 016 TaxID=2107694 RepID=A0A2T1LUR2_9CHRO|nr:TerB family tellurite resistance protein [Aphanothece hegewaldii]PSF35246.1 Tellurite resistance protein TerB [Aphanothece hegewaldii CCALA 016]